MLIASVTLPLCTTYNMKYFFLALIPLLVSCSEKKEGIKPTYGVLTESVYASVIVQPQGLYNVYPTVAGILDSLLVEEGDLVNQGQTIALIVSQSPKIASENARLNMELAESKYQGSATLLGTIEQEISLAKAQLSLDSVNFVRQQNLWNQNIGSQSEFENRKLKYEQSQNNLDLLNQRYEQTQVELKNTYRRSKNALDQANNNLQDYSIQSRMDGMVFEILKEEGEFISSQSVLAKLGKAESFVLKMQVDEVDIAQIAVGQSCIISLDAYPDQTFDARITKIYPFKNERTQTFEVEAVMDNPPKVLYAGLAGEANIILEIKEEVLSIPIEYLLENNRVKTSDGEVEVEIGIRNMERVEIISGIDSSSTIYKP
jgi:multidrug efflux pump subunit AcrA (membrane-fusion protein)